ncbi:hypothetical protein [Bacteroides helcogenes]|uniref:hypothetical protein n=1 Tax=Bacteroides helcogenes TaxID=290053 RepID=UPI0003013EFC|nr:hypothetical protein [Bacteroides helcogenes]MDY5237133.1 hypothetical protein [Bacteroides helcogenes]
MAGILRANYGFETGIANTRILETYSRNISNAEDMFTSTEYSIKVTGNLKVGGSNIYIGGRQLLRYDADQATAIIYASHIEFQDASVHSSGEWMIGDKETGVSISPTRLAVGGYDVYHRNNSNLATVDWTMQNGMVQQNLSVHGDTVLDGSLD